MDEKKCDFCDTIRRHLQFDEENRLFELELGNKPIVWRYGVGIAHMAKRAGSRSFVNTGYITTRRGAFKLNYCPTCGRSIKSLQKEALKQKDDSK